MNEASKAKLDRALVLTRKVLKAINEYGTEDRLLRLAATELALANELIGQVSDEAKQE